MNEAPNAPRPRREQIAWRLPVKRHDPKLKAATWKYPPAFLAALAKYAQLESERTGKKVGRPTILVTLALRGSSELRRLYKEAQRTPAKK